MERCQYFVPSIETFWISFNKLAYSSLKFLFLGDRKKITVNGRKMLRYEEDDSKHFELSIETFYTLFDKIARTIRDRKTMAFSTIDTSLRYIFQ